MWIHTILYLFLIVINVGYIITLPISYHHTSSDEQFSKQNVQNISAPFCRSLLTLLIFSELFIVSATVATIFFIYISVKLSEPLDYYW